MTQQAQIALLAAALEEVGKMPEYAIHRPLQYGWVIQCSLSHDEAVNEPAVLAALVGVAYSHCAENSGGVRKLRDRQLYRITGDLYKGAKTVGLYATEIEALAAAVKIAGKGEGK